MAAVQSPVPSRAPPAGSVASIRTRRTAKGGPADGGSIYERRKSAVSVRAPTVIPADSISQAGDRPESSSHSRHGQRAQHSQAADSHDGSHRLTAEALEALSERNSDTGSHATATHQVEVVEEIPSAKQTAHSRASRPAASGTRSHAVSKTARETAARSHIAASQTARNSAPSARSVTKAGSTAVSSRLKDIAASRHSSRKTAVDFVEVTEQVEQERSVSDAGSRSARNSQTARSTTRTSAAAPAVPRPNAPSQAKTRVSSHTSARVPAGSVSSHHDVEVPRSVASHRIAKSMTSRTPSHAASHHSSTTTTRSKPAPESSHHTIRESSATPVAPTSPTAPQPPPAFATSHSETRVEEDMQLVKRSSYDVVAPARTEVDVVEVRRRDGRLVEREYAIAPAPRAWQPSVSVGVADGTVYRKHYRRRRPQRVVYMRRRSSYGDGY